MGLIAIGVSLNSLMKWAQPKQPKGDFPRCMTPGCVRTCIRQSAEGRIMPSQVIGYLIDHDLRPNVVTRYVCPKGHTEVWYVPRLGDAERCCLVSRNL